MVLEKPIVPFLIWLPMAMIWFLMVVGALGGLAILFGFSVTSIQNGPAAAAQICWRVLRESWRDLRDCSFGRIYAMAMLAVKESLRRYVIVVFAVFAIILLFAGWYLDAEADNPAVLYISFVLKSTNFLLILLAVLLSAFSIPNDIVSKTIYTVVTKPVRAWEIVIGRILGFGAIGTGMLVLMGLCSYVFVYRGIAHTHQVDVSTVATDPKAGGWIAKTTRDSSHRHELRVNAQGSGQTLPSLGHFHTVRRTEGDATNPQWMVGPAEGALQARVPVYGNLRFLNREGKLNMKNGVNTGINVGKEFTYRGYVEGNTLSAGIFRFDQLRSKDFPEGLPLEMTIRIFRTYQGEIERGIRGTLVLRNPAADNPESWEAARAANPDVARESEPFSFYASEFTPASMVIRRRIDARMPDDTLREVDVFESLMQNGSIDVVIQCDEGAQYFGMGLGDVYLRAADRSFALNFAKTYVTLWLQMMIVTAFGVMFSTFLSGPVAMFATISSMVMGFFAQSIFDVASGKQQGGGPLESMVRIFRQDNMITEIDVGTPTRFLIKLLDAGSMFVMKFVASIMPNFNDYAELGGINTGRFAAYGFDIPPGLMGQHIAITLAFLLVITAASYYFLKTKEIAA